MNSLLRNKLAPSFWEAREKHILGHKVIHHDPLKELLFPNGGLRAVYPNGQRALTEEQMVHSIIQWLAFSEQFPVVQAMHLASAPTKEIRRDARSILGNELGVAMNHETGDIEGREFSHNGAHIEWLENEAEKLGIDTASLNYFRLASYETAMFIAFLKESYGSDDPSYAAGASHAVEEWAGYGLDKKETVPQNFWSREIALVEDFNKNMDAPPLKMGFWKYHRNLEVGHVANVESSLMQIVDISDFDEEAWLEGGVRALDGVYKWFEGRAKFIRETADSLA